MAQTTTMTLTDFLEARLTEDERLTNAMAQMMPSVAMAARAVREVEAKRAIVADLRKCEVLRDEHGHATEYSTGELGAYRSVAHFLASVYADHPDYRADWA